MWKFVIFTFLIWRGFLFLAEKFGEAFLPQRIGFLGPTIWANFDGVHYLSIAQQGYFQYEQAFFPLFPLLIKGLTFFFGGNYLIAALSITYASLLTLLIFFWKLIKIDFGNSASKWGIVVLLTLPPSFFFASVYTESLFLMLALGAFYAARKRRWWAAGILGGLASATRLVGIFLLPALLWEWWEQNKLKDQRSKLKATTSQLLWLLLIPLGLVLYVVYLWRVYGDPLLFIHSQPAFGAQRSGGELIFLPQVYWRYLKIFFTVSAANYDFWIAIFEFLIFNFAFVLLWLAYKKKIRTSYLIFSFFALVTPALSGTLSSMPRYTLAAFPIFMVLAQFNNLLLKTLFFIISLLLLVILTSLFTRGFFVA